MSRKEVIRIGDQVEVLAPIKFIRCGYKLTLNEVADQIYKDKQQEIFEFVRESLKPQTSDRVVRTKISTNASLGIARALAYEVIADQIRTGNKRRLFLEPTELSHFFHSKRPLEVFSKKVVRTGIYSSAYKGSGWFSGWDEDYEPAYLSKEKAYVVLEVGPNIFDKDWILAMHVRKVNV